MGSGLSPELQKRIDRFWGKIPVFYKENSMRKEDIAQELAEEIRVNSALRHRLGMEEGSESGQLDADDADTVAFTNTEGESWFIKVGQ